MSPSAQQATDATGPDSTAPPTEAKAKSAFSTSDMKPANKPMLVHQRWKAKQAIAREEEARAKEGKTKADGRAYGGRGGSMWVWAVARWMVWAVLGSVFLSRAVTNTWFWGHGSKYDSLDKVCSQPLIKSTTSPSQVQPSPANFVRPPALRTRARPQIRHLVIPPPPQHLSLAQLARHDGSDPRFPVYVALDGDVYDVSRGNGLKSYGPGGAYHFFAGRDAARAYVTGCFSDPAHLTYDTRGLDDGQLGVSTKDAGLT